MRRLRTFLPLLLAIAVSCCFLPGMADAKPVKIQLEKPRAIVQKQWMKVGDEKMPQWIVQVGRLYMQQDKNSSPEQLLTILEEKLGIKASGVLDLVQAWESEYELANVARLAGNYLQENTLWLSYIKDLLSLTGFNYIYFQTCMLHRDKYRDRFIRYFENGFYPSRYIFSTSPEYYRSLYYYLLLVTNDLFRSFGRATELLNSNPSVFPGFITDDDIFRFGVAIRVALELDDFISNGTAPESKLSGRLFSPKELSWLKKTVDYYANIDTHAALMSFDWFKTKIPLSISADVISHDIIKQWNSQAIAYRTRLPLMFFVDEDEGGQRVSIESLFGSTLKKLRLDNRSVDMMVMTALKTWLAKQVNHGLRIEDRIVYNTILSELKECPTGWIFANLYDCRNDLAALKRYMEKWGKVKNRQHVFKTKVMDSFLDAREKIDRVFGDLEKIFGKHGQEEQTSYIFYKYRGEIYYYFKWIEFETFKDKEPIIPAAGPEDNFLKDFQIAFVKAPDNPQNHINLINGYALLFRRLFADGRIGEMQRLETGMQSFIRGAYRLGSILSHKDNNLYDIYRVLTYAYLSSGDLGPRALENARLGFELAKNYYVKAAKRAGFVLDGRVGAITVRNTEMDDYQRQFELYRDVAKKMGKRIELLLPEEDIRLYNRIQAIQLENYAR